jgi:signal recognition particle subunit SRP54
MFDALSKGFRAAKNRLSGVTELTSDNIEQALRDVRLSLLEADVELNVVKRFLATVKEKAIGETMKSAATVKGQRSGSARPRSSSRSARTSWSS